ncbi:SUMO1 sentrin specific peptidase 8, partial [Coemansia sp. RSA 2599]
MGSDFVVLDFENAEVRNSDFESLQPEGWLTGEIINFYWTYLERREFHSESSVLFLGTYTSYRIANAESAQVTDKISKQLSQELGSKRHLILIPLNHRSHWSLLVYCRLTRTFYHYDSINKHNRNFAERAAGRFLRVLEPNMKDGFYFKSMQTPQQNNDYDCGVYVLAIAEELARRYINHVKKTRRSSRHGERVPRSTRVAEPASAEAARSQQQQQQQQQFKERMQIANAYDRLNGARDFDHDIASRAQQTASSSLPHRKFHSPTADTHVRAATNAAAGTASPHATLPGRAMVSDLLMPRFGQPFAGFQSPFEMFYRSPGSDFYAKEPEPILKGGGLDGG